MVRGPGLPCSLRGRKKAEHSSLTQGPSGPQSVQLGLDIALPSGSESRDPDHTLLARPFNKQAARRRAQSTAGPSRLKWRTKGSEPRQSRRGLTQKGCPPERRRTLKPLCWGSNQLKFYHTSHRKASASASSGLSLQAWDNTLGLRWSSGNS